jgi:hypothetical protein
MSQNMNFPDFVLERVKTISQRTEISEEEILRDYEELFSDPFIQQDPQFQTEEERHRYAVAVLWTRYISRPPVREYEIIPIGFSPLRTTKTGGEMASLFALVKTPNGVKLKRIVLRGEMTEKRKEITLFCKYVPKLGEFSSGDLIADNRSKFENPVKIALEPHQMLERLGIKRINIKQAEKFPSQVGSDGYINTTDWRIIRGIIVRANRGTRDDGTEWGVYTIADETVNDEPVVTPDGRILRPGFTCWVAPEFMIYEEESECDFVGTVQIDRKTGEPFMNAYLILPIHAKTR